MGEIYILSCAENCEYGEVQDIRYFLNIEDAQKSADRKNNRRDDDYYEYEVRTEKLIKGLNNE